MNSFDDITITIHEDELDRSLKNLPELGDSALAVAEKIAAVARATAPVGSGSYAAGITVQPFRGGARVFATDPKSAWVEFGVPGHLDWGETVDPIPATHNLRRAAESLGLSFKTHHG